MLIGQDALRRETESLILDNKFPRVVTVVGRYGYGKSTFINYCASKLNVSNIITISTIDDVRDLIVNAPTFNSNTIAWITSFEKLNFRAKETLLKLCEDIPKYLYIFIEVTNISLYEDRYINRSRVFTLQPYTKSELLDIIKFIKSDVTQSEIDDVMSMFGSPADFKFALDYGASNLKQYMNKVMSNIFMAQSFNLLKICDSLNTKADDGKLDFITFFRAISNLSYRTYLKTNDLQYKKLFICANDVCSELTNVSKPNKRFIFDRFVFSLKEGVNYDD